jgi:hypothetical protein
MPIKTSTTYSLKDLVAVMAVFTAIGFIIGEAMLSPFFNANVQKLNSDLHKCISDSVWHMPETIPVDFKIHMKTNLTANDTGNVIDWVELSGHLDFTQEMFNAFGNFTKNQEVLK